MQKRVTILGSTGSVGRSTLSVIDSNSDKFKVKALAARSNAKLLIEQVHKFCPEVVAVVDETSANEVRDAVADCEVLTGIDSLSTVAMMPADTVMCALVGSVGLHPLLAAIQSGNTVAVANKEPFVMAGGIIIEQAKKSKVDILPVDSEHSAVFQCLVGNNKQHVNCIYLTASGGPFYGKGRWELKNITPEQAMRHPTWAMGPKISVDSATLMNKGLEIIEAMWLFGLRCDQVQVLIHPQSIVHSIVEFIDGSMLAQLGVTDMRAPIAYALNYPERRAAPAMRLDLANLTSLQFSKPDMESFRCLALARTAAEKGGTAPAVLNAANEVAVEYFCLGSLNFLQIADVVEQTLDQCTISAADDLDVILEADRMAREYASTIIKKMDASR